MRTDGTRNIDRTSLSRWIVALASLVAAATLPRVSAAQDAAAAVLRDDPGRTVLQFDADGYRFDPVVIQGKSFVRVVLPRESPLLIAGAPELPVISRSIAIPNGGSVSAHVVAVEYREHDLIDVAPSKGLLYRSVDPASVPYTFGADYARDVFFPRDVVSVGEPYILRDQRGVVLQVHPFQYNPVQRKLRVLHKVTVEMRTTGHGGANVLQPGPAGESLAFRQLQRRHFLNRAGRSRYAPLGEQGEMVIIAHDAWLPNLQPLVAHKNAVGIPTTAVGVSTIGNTPAAIHAYLKDLYSTGNLAFVLLVGDADEVATPYAASGASDPSYTKLAGTDDYPDILLGRFSAESAEDVDTQVQRTIEYETMPATEQEWFRKAMGIGSNEGPGDDAERDWEHIDSIRNDLVTYGYTQVDKLYDPGASASEVTAALEEGRGLINYCGHGSADSWVTTGFNNGDVEQLDNAGMLPFIFSVACNNGEFDTGTCFAESWLRARKSGAPTGAIGIYASSISQSWDPPMAAQDEAADLLTTEQYVTFGGLCFAGSGRMMDEYGAGGVDMFDTWHVFGDPSLRVFGRAGPPTGLRVTPFAQLSTIGDPGGPFDPGEIVYTLENFDSAPVDFAVTNVEPWITVSPPTGSIAPATTASVTVSVNANAGTLDFGSYQDTIQFTNLTHHDGDTARHVKLKVGMPHLQYEWNLDADPGWNTQSAWAFGPPTGHGGLDNGNPDPSAGRTGTNVYGFNLDGDYPNDMHSPRRLTTKAIDCSKLTEVSLRFWRWLNVLDGQSDVATIEVSTNGVFWNTVWKNTGLVQDSEWTQQTVSLGKLADHEAVVYVRWAMGPTDASQAASGWNLDDIQLWGIKTCWDEDGDGDMAPLCGGTDCRDDLAAVHPGATEVCDDLLDNDCDGATDALDTDCTPDGGTGGAAGADGGDGAAGEGGAAGTAGAAGDGGGAGAGGSGGVTDSGGTDAPGPDSSIASDAGTDAAPSTASPASDDTGCSCRAASMSDRSGATWVAGLALLAASAIRRRRNG